jgi:NAD(P)H-hydrate epimerase
MSDTPFETPAGIPVPAVTAAEMREVDRVAVETVGLQLLQMMENAGRALAASARERGRPVVVVAGAGGNGGGGLAAARHLATRDVEVAVVLDRSPAALSGAAATQWEILDAMAVPTGVGVDALPAAANRLAVDALVGYGLEGPLDGPAAALATAVSEREWPALSLDVPSGRNATTGATPGPAIEPAHVLTLALPKPGLAGLDATLELADIAIPAAVYDRLSLPHARPFEEGYRVALVDR